MPSASTTGSPATAAGISGSSELLPPISLEIMAVAFSPVHFSIARSAS